MKRRRQVFRNHRRIATKKKRVIKRRVNEASAQWKIRLNSAFNAGLESAGHEDMLVSLDPFKQLNKLWNDWLIRSNYKLASWKNYAELARQYVKGFCVQAGKNEQDWLLIPTTKSVSAVVTVMNEETTISSVLHQLNRMPLHDIIVIVNGTTDNSFYKIRQQSKAIIIHYAQPLGHDIGRAIGAKMTQSDILLFLDGDFPIFAEHLVPFIYEVEQGKDMVLNNISPFIHHFSKRDSVTMFKEFLNRGLRRIDLRANSLTAVPHALSRRAIDVIGYANLAVPPKAQAKANECGLNISSSISVDVVTVNKQRARLNMGAHSPVSELIIGDHIEALASVMVKKGARLDFDDDIRNRALAGGHDQ